MRAATHPDAIDLRHVLRIYGWLALTIGTLLVGWGPLWVPASGPPSLPWADAALLRTAAAVLAAAGCCALGYAASDDARGRRRGVYGFAAAHLLFGTVFYAQWNAVLEPIVPRAVAWAPLALGLILLYLAHTGPTSDVPRWGALLSLFGPRTPGGRPDRTDAALRSEYEEQIRRAARQEERRRDRGKRGGTAGEPDGVASSGGPAGPAAARGIDGIETTRRIRERMHEVRVIALTASMRGWRAFCGPAPPAMCARTQTPR
jgi:hypothetical protein